MHGIESAFKHIQQAVKKVNDEINRVKALQQNRLAQIASIFQKDPLEPLNALGEPVIKPAVQEMMLNGWYPDENMTIGFMREVGEALASKQSTEACRQLFLYFTESLSRIEVELSSLCPDRAHIIKSAFEAHRRGEYILSVPVLLAQADGICQEKINKEIYSKKKSKKKKVSLDAD
ncbi:MAG: hypothetical protein HC866_12835 [Leptolyngbyaceae cyanobacterium RU_5_1]|nr:hypothetical protein [Leptolyngbyaceae cyanobacterium RU_5_1]